MSVEAIGSAVGRVASVAPAISRGTGPAIGRSIPFLEGRFPGAETRGFPLKGFLGDQPTVDPLYIEDRGSSLLDSNIGVIRNPLSLQRASLIEAKAPSQTISVADTDLPSGAEAVDMAEQWLGISSQPQKNHYIRDREHNEGIQQRIIEPVARPRNFIWKQPEILPLLYLEPLIKEKNDPKIQPNMGKIELSKSAPGSGVLTQLDKRSVQENPVKQIIVEKEGLIEERVDKKTEVLETAEIEEFKLKDLLDEEVVEQRVYEISEAIDLAEAEVKKEGVEEIEGWRIIKFLRLHIGLISQIARKIRKDGSLDETLEELSAKKFSSKSEAKKQSKELVTQKEPVKRGKEGKTVREGAVARVFKYHLVKRSPNEEVVTRAVKKQAIQAGNSKEAQVLALEPAGVKEQRIEDTGLAEVPPKAA